MTPPANGAGFFFPISPASHAFSTQAVTQALGALPKTYARAVAVVFDGLALYNRAAEIGSDGGFAQVLNPLNRVPVDGVNRKQWFSRLAAELQDIGQLPKQVEAMEYREIADGHLLTALRRILASFSLEAEFRRDVESVALEHVRRSGKVATESRLRLSEFYVLEEIAANVRVRLPNELADEYYMGSFHEPLLRLYEGHYSFLPADLVGSDCDTSGFTFYSWIASSWRQVRATRS